MRRPTRKLDVARSVGMSAGAIFGDLALAHRGVKGVRVRRYGDTPTVQSRITERASMRLVEAALAYRDNADVPFWHSVMKTMERAGSITDELLTAAMYHQGPGRAKVLSREMAADGYIRKLAALHEFVGMDSMLQFDDLEMHLPFMDFRISPSEEHTKIVVAVCKRLLPDGFVILDSGRSYHASGVVVHSKEERVVFLGRSLLFAPIVDDRYVAHQIQQESSTLRISSGGEGRIAPTVVAAWHP